MQNQKRQIAICRCIILFFVTHAFSSCWIEADYCIWTIQKNPVDLPLLTKASFADPIPGAIGEPGTVVLLGDEDISMPWLNGFQIGAGVGMLEGNYFYFPHVSKSRKFLTTGEPGGENLAVPFYDVTGVCGLGGVPGETVYVLPGPIFKEPGDRAVFALHITSRFQGAELFTNYRIQTTRRIALDSLFGIAWFELKEAIRYNGTTVTVPDYPGAFEMTSFTDRFNTKNDFFGAELGLKARIWAARKWDFEGTFKGMLGGTLERIKIDGTIQTGSGTLWFTTIGTANDVLKGGIFSQPSNIGNHHHFSFAGALGLKIASNYHFNPSFTLDLAYSLLWLSQVIRPGNEMDHKINSTTTSLADASRATVGTGPGPIPFPNPGPAPTPRGPNRPKVKFKGRSFWAQGFNLGLRYNF